MVSCPFWLPPSHFIPAPLLPSPSPQGLGARILLCSNSLPLEQTSQVPAFPEGPSGDHASVKQKEIPSQRHFLASEPETGRLAMEPGKQQPGRPSPWPPGAPEKSPQSCLQPAGPLTVLAFGAWLPVCSWLNRLSAKFILPLTSSFPHPSGAQGSTTKPHNARG